jgi:hypothetical protein
MELLRMDQQSWHIPAPLCNFNHDGLQDQSQSFNFFLSLTQLAFDEHLPP